MGDLRGGSSIPILEESIRGALNEGALRFKAIQEGALTRGGLSSAEIQDLQIKRAKIDFIDAQWPITPGTLTNDTTVSNRMPKDTLTNESFQKLINQTITPGTSTNKDLNQPAWSAELNDKLLALNRERLGYQPLPTVKPLTPITSPTVTPPIVRNAGNIQLGNINIENAEDIPALMATVRQAQDKQRTELFDTLKKTREQTMIDVKNDLYGKQAPQSK